MGDIVKGLGNLFGGGQQEPAIPSGTAPLDVLLGTLPATGQEIRIPADAGEVMGPDITVEGFAPTKRNALGQIADAVLMAYGKPRIYENRMVARDTKRALKGFTSDDPAESMESLRRLMQVNPEAALPVWNQFMDNRRADEVARRQAMIAQEAVLDRVASMYASVTEENAERMIPLIRQYGIARGLREEDMIDSYNPEAIQAWRFGAVPVDNQMDNRRDAIAKQALIDYRGVRADQFERNLQSQVEDRTLDRTERERHNRAMEARPTRGGASPSGKKSSGVREVDTVHGKGKVSSDGTRLSVTVNGEKRLYDISGGLDQAVRIQ